MNVFGNPYDPRNPFMQKQIEQGANLPSLQMPKGFGQVQQAMAQPEPEKKPWMQTPGMFGVDRQAAMMGGLGLLMGGY